MPRKSPSLPTSAPLKSATVNDFSGGWNQAESEIRINSRSAVVLDNLYYGIDGSLKVRQGTLLHADLEPIATDDFVDGYFFFAYIISVAKDGSLYATDGIGNSARVWPSVVYEPWSSLLGVSFVEMNGNLIIHNGVNKPLEITSGLGVRYLTDVDGTNFDVPIGLVAHKHNDHHVIAVGSVLHISHPKAPGTFVGDPAPNIAVQIDLGSRVTRGDKTVTAMVTYRDTLLVMFKQCIIPVNITLSDTPLIVTTIDDAIDNYGAFSHRVVQNLGDDVLFADIVGVNSIARTVFSKTLSPAYVSQDIAPAMQAAIDKLDTDTLKYIVFSIYDNKEKAFILFVPNNSSQSEGTEPDFEHPGFMYVKQERPRKIAAWSRIRGWNWHFACRSAQNEVFFGKDKQIFQWGRSGTNEVSVDFKGDQETFSDGTIFTDGTGWTPVSDVETSGIPIKFVWELPWSYLKKRENIKLMKFLSVDTEGTGIFNAKLFTDYIYFAPDAGEEFSDGTLFTDNTGWMRWEPLLNPQLDMEFIGRDISGYGGDPFGSFPFGGGRTTADVRLYSFPSKFKLMKLRFEGEIVNPLEFVAITVSYLEGSIRR